MENNDGMAVVLLQRQDTDVKSRLAGFKYLANNRLLKFLAEVFKLLSFLHTNLTIT